MIEIGYALKHVGTGRMAFFFQPKDAGDKVPFDVDNLMYDKIQDSAEIAAKVKPRIESILEKAVLGEL